MSNTKISLAIFGNPNSNSGFQPLYWINDPPQQLDNFIPPGMDENLYFYTFMVQPGFTQYELIHNRVSSYMSIRQGVLKIAITIPRGYRLSGGASPLDVLLTLRETFVETCLTKREEHSDVYNFKDKLVEPSVFASIVDSYELEPTSAPHYPMKGTDDALLLLDDASISQFFVSPHYPRLSAYRRLVLAHHGKETAYAAHFNKLDALLGQAKASHRVQANKVKDYPDETDDDNQNTSVTMRPDRHRGLKPWYLLVCFALGIVAGIVATKLLSRPHQEQEEATDVEQAEDPLKQFPKYQSLLAKPNLTFDEVHEMAKWAARTKGTIDHLTAQGDSLLHFIARIEKYDSLCSLLSSGDYPQDEEARTAELQTLRTMIEACHADSTLEVYHFIYARAAYEQPCDKDGDSFQEYDNPAAARDAFLKNRSRKHYKSFKDIFDVALGQNINEKTPDDQKLN